MKKILFFTAGALPTSDELTAIAALNTMAEAPYDVQVRNGDIPAQYQPNNEEADYAAGTVPDAFSDLPVFDPDNPPAPELPATQAVVSNAQVIDTADGGTVTLTIADNAITSAVYAAGA